ncbi:hypothetical protein AB0L40_13085 [Patulibacter sp. NPDC049589]|uniref:hypothetical protein n=1 Tax=Patulibacter sp. NPDC049589 TaxID=3154731 RepID=UPI003413E8B6
MGVGIVGTHAGQLSDPVGGQVGTADAGNLDRLAPRGERSSQRGTIARTGVAILCRRPVAIGDEADLRVTEQVAGRSVALNGERLAVVAVSR